MSNHLLNIIRSPMLTEKSNSLTQQFNKYVFRVDVKSNKLEIKKAIELRFDVKVAKVSTIIVKGKSKNTTIKSGGHVIRTTGNRESWKKAIVTLNDGDSINLVDGEL